MKKIIYYFTGTGNSLYTAKKIAGSTPDTKLIRITGETLPVHDQNSIVGVVFPVYMYRPPRIVTRFIKKFTVKPDYTFVVATCAGESGMACSVIKRLLKKSGVNLSAYFNLVMPSNYLPFGEAVSGDEMIKLFDEADSKIDLIKKTVDSKENRFDKDNSWFKTRVIPGLLFGMGYNFIPYMAGGFKLNSECNGCGICAKVCPVQNITMADGKPDWGKKCEQCFGCINLCPQNAINYGKKTFGMKRYKNPSIKTSELF